MAFVHCRECGHEIQADTKQTRCEKCGSFFPFTCAVCDKFLRPPFAVLEDERYVTEDNRPLCPDHYQRQCPECNKWFQADENPGFFLCRACGDARQQRLKTPAVPSTENSPKTRAPKTAAQPRTSRHSPSLKHAGVKASKSYSTSDYATFAAIAGAAIIGLLFLLSRLGGG